MIQNNVHTTAHDSIFQSVQTVASRTFGRSRHTKFDQFPLTRWIDMRARKHKTQIRSKGGAQTAFIAR